MPLELLPKRETKWTIIMVNEAQEIEDHRVIWWRPNMKNYSKDDPESDPCWVTEE